MIKNKHEVIGDTLYIYIVNRKKEKFTALASVEDKEKLEESNLSWHVRWDKCIEGYYVRAHKYLGTFDGNPKYETILLHKFILDCDCKDVIHHINHDTLDNRRDNLDATSRTNNSTDRKGKNSNNSSGYRNVSKIGKWWCVQMQVDGKNTLLKKFPLDQLHEAGAYAMEMRNTYYGEFAGAS